MKKIILIAFITAISLSAQTSNPFQPSFLGYYDQTRFTFGAPSAFKFGLYGFGNPAITNSLQDTDALIGLSSNTTEFNSIDSWTFQGAAPGFGYGVISTTNGFGTVYDYRINTALGDRNFSLGLGYGFVGGDKGALGRSNTAHWGFLWRPLKYLSIGGNQTWSIDNANTETVLELAVRPFGNELVTLFGDVGSFANTQGFQYDFADEFSYSAGAVIEILDGIRLAGRYRSIQDIESIDFGIDISYGTRGLGVTSNAPSEGNGDNSLTTLFRFGAQDRTLFDDISPIKYYVKVNLAGGVKYQKNIFFDNSKTLLNTIVSLDRIKENESIKGVIINTVGFSANPSMSWEIREKIKEIKRSGKTVYMFMERGDLNDYHFASVADKIIIDDMGSLTLNGYILGRSFYKNLLDKYDIGFNEIRLFKYKSAVETYSRTDYSEGNIEQNQALLDSWFATTLDEISKEREGIEKEKLEELINTKLFIDSDDALEDNLVDATGRWHNLDSVMKEFDEDFSFAVDYGFIAAKKVPFDDNWGPSVESIAVIYVDGVCAMESGIKARSLVKYVKRAVDNPSIKAIVLRVDSPGGDALASEYIAEVVRKNEGKKPIIVSQGMLAASGGYWLSMDGDDILSSPYTITGSIGVITAWIYDKGLAADNGITTDKVQVGKYADLGFAWSDPLLGLGLPVRNLTEDEENKFKDNVLELYGDFINRVAEGREMDSLEVHNVAQGRIWSGRDAIQKGLVDKIGGLSDAIELAKNRVGIDEDDDVFIYEYPKPEAFDWQSLLNGMTGVETKKVSERLETLQWIYANRGYPMPIVPLEYLEYDIEN